MEFKRNIYQDLLSWKDTVKRKPLLLMGARQIGKTTILKAFGKSEFEDVVYINLEKEMDVHSFFKTNKSPKSIIDNLSLFHGQQIEANNTLVILDEIQECRDALIALKYFAEELPQLHIIGAGSLLGLTIGNNRSFPVGKVSFLDMYPLSFSEYLLEANPKNYKSYHHFIESETIDLIPDAFFNSIQESFKTYLLLGGMPEVAAHVIENRNIESAQKIQDEILRAYELDAIKHVDGNLTTKIQHVWNSIPSQLAKENKKFLYSALKSGARAREYEIAIQWLIQAGLVYKIPRVKKVGIPLKAYEDLSAFKIYLFETGLLMRLANLNPKTFINGDQFFKEFKGALAENYVAQSLYKFNQRSLYYWTSDGKAEVDFLIEHLGNCIPIEVKSGTTTKAKSLTVYKNKYNPKLRIRISNLNLKLTDDLLNIPLFYSDYLDKFVGKALKA